MVVVLREFEENESTVVGEESEFGSIYTQLSYRVPYIHLFFTHGIGLLYSLQ